MAPGGFKLAHQGRQPVAYRLVERVAVPACGFADCTRAASDPARPALCTGPRGARSTAQAAAKACCDVRKTRPEAEKYRDGAPKGEGARKRMFAVTRNIRGARRTGRGLGCAHPKCRCGYYRLRRSALRLPLFFWRQTLSCSGLPRLGRKKTRRGNGDARAHYSHTEVHRT